MMVSETRDKLIAIGNAGITKPKHELDFLSNLTYKAAGGQQLQGNCIFCSLLVTSTEATRVVDHLVLCQLFRPEIRTMCKALVSNKENKRKAKQEHFALVQEERDGVVPHMQVQKE